MDASLAEEGKLMGFCKRNLSFWMKKLGAISSLSTPDRISGPLG